MKALIVIDIDDNHLVKETNEIYERLKGYKCELKPMPEKMEHNPENMSEEDEMMGFIDGWNAYLKEIEK